jgi:hypothetical protein
MGEWLMELVADEIGEEPEKVKAVYALVWDIRPERKPKVWDDEMDILGVCILNRWRRTETVKRIVQKLADTFKEAISNVPELANFTG